ncbi:unnamed protein product [Rhodiola kirilowii]
MKLTFVVLHLLICSTVASAAFSSPDRYRSNRLRSSVPPQQYLELTQPLPSDNILPSCSHPVLLNHSFANTYNRPPTCRPIRSSNRLSAAVELRCFGIAGRRSRRPVRSDCWTVVRRRGGAADQHG